MSFIAYVSGRRLIGTRASVERQEERHDERGDERTDGVGELSPEVVNRSL